jgi:hypothetical protein
MFVDAPTSGATTWSGSARMSRTHRFAKRAAWALVTGISIYLVLPGLVELFSTWPELNRVSITSLVAMTVLTAVSMACSWAQLGVCLHSRAWALLATSQLASGAVTRIVPGGAATASAVQYRLLADAGVDRATAATGTAASTFLNFWLLFALPLFALPAIFFGPPIDSALVESTLLSAIGFVLGGVAGALLLFWNRPLAAAGTLVDSISARRAARGASSQPAAERFLEARDRVRATLARAWYWAVLGSLGRWVFDYLALVLAVWGTGQGGSAVGLLLAFVVASILGRIPLTPGGLGFVEAGLTGTLILAGVTAGNAVLATLAYRLVSYWLPIPVGALAYGVHRYRMRRVGVDIDPFIDVGEEEMEHAT